MLVDGDEIALVDAREEGTFGQSHILYASCLPLSRLELRAAQMLPRRALRTVVCDGGEGLAERAAARLGELGYLDVAVLAGGTPAWAAAGYELFSGVNVPSKAFGELVEHQYDTPSLGADELKARIEAGADMVILDSRPFTEFEARCIPGGTCVPGAELVYRLADVAPSRDTAVVVNCAGRTRSIIGAQSLINAGIPNPVYALRNGTMGWHLAGHEVESGARRRYPEISSPALALASERARAVSERFGVRTIDHHALHHWREEADAHTLYILDVRSPEEFAFSHLPGSHNAPGGQLVQETDHHLAVQHARVVLVDDTGVRARMTASWLVQMGWENVVVLEDAFEGQTMVRGPEPANVLGRPDPEPASIGAAALDAALGAGGVEVVDLSLSRAYLEAHVPGAWYAVRARLASALVALPPCGRLVLTSEDGVVAALAAAEAEALVDAEVLVLAGGNHAWGAAGLATAAGPERMADEVDDVWLRPYEKDWGVEEAMQGYLTWEVGLVEQIERDGTARFQGRDRFPS